MTLAQLDLESRNKTDAAIAILKDNEPPEGYYFADSGGKDSCVTRDILIKSGVKFDAHYNVSPIDPPQIYDFLKEHHPDTQWEYNARGWWRMVETKGLPMRKARWCCKVIKEAGGSGRMVVVGNRGDESRNRKKQPYINADYNDNTKLLVRPILLFSDEDVWEYIRLHSIDYCYLYDEGAKRKGYGEGYFKRLGCVLCPFSRNIAREEEYFPKVVENWKRVCQRLVDATKVQGYKTKTGKPVKNKFETGEEMYKWWVHRD